jgi:hypothetical protein
LSLAFECLEEGAKEGISGKETFGAKESFTVFEVQPGLVLKISVQLCGCVIVRENWKML